MIKKKPRNKRILIYLYSLIGFGLIFLFTIISVVEASPMKALENNKANVIEHIRLSVPGENKNSWLLAEKKSWEPWLKEKSGFLDRQLLWDKDKEEAIVLITWSSRREWKSIPQAEISSVQEIFEETARELTNQKVGNPFPIVFEGELLPQ